MILMNGAMLHRTYWWAKAYYYALFNKIGHIHYWKKDKFIREAGLVVGCVRHFSVQRNLK